MQLSAADKFRAMQHATTFGYACGIVMAIGASTSFVAARFGILEGLGPHDLVFARFTVAGLVLLPILVRAKPSTLAGIGWPRGIALTLTGGPLFAILQNGGYAFAPLAHGAVIAPSVVIVASTIAAVVLLRERFTPSHWVGTFLVLAGIALIAWRGATTDSVHSATWVGDVLFVVSSLLWAAFTVLVRYWKLDAIKVTAVVAVLSLCLTAPLYAAYAGVAHLAGLPLKSVITQGAVQGLVQAVVTIAAYSQSILILGVGRAVLFPASVPAITILIGALVIGELPTTIQIGGLALVSAGLFVAVGLFSAFASRRSGTDAKTPQI